MQKKYTNVIVNYSAVQVDVQPLLSGVVATFPGLPHILCTTILICRNTNQIGIPKSMVAPCADDPEMQAPVHVVTSIVCPCNPARVAINMLGYVRFVGQHGRCNRTALPEWFYRGWPVSVYVSFVQEVSSTFSNSFHRFPPPVLVNVGTFLQQYRTSFSFVIVASGLWSMPQHTSSACRMPL